MINTLPKDIILLIKGYYTEFEECRAREYWNSLIHPKVTIMVEMRKIRSVERIIPSVLKKYFLELKTRHNRNIYDYNGNGLFKHMSYSEFVLNFIPKKGCIILSPYQARKHCLNNSCIIKYSYKTQNNKGFLAHDLLI